MRKELLLSSVLPGARGAVTHSRSLLEAVPLSRFAVIHRTSLPAVELQLEELVPEIFLQDLALCLHVFSAELIFITLKYLVEERKDGKGE
ncbi:unnamed protein product [Coccothraustes coccothraustes]